VKQSANTRQPIEAVCFPVDAQTGYAAGWDGVLLKTTNGGAAWAPLSPGVANTFSGICFPDDALTGYVSASAGLVLETTDGGTTWVPKSTGSGDYLASVHFPTSDTGYVAGASASIFRTTNRGDIWVLQAADTEGFLTSVRFPVDAQTGYAVGRGGTILKTTDGGAAVDEPANGERGTRNGLSTAVRGVLFLAEAASPKPQAASLMDATGRKVMDLLPGANDVRALAPGVYFVRGEGRGTGDAGRIRKVVLTR